MKFSNINIKPVGLYIHIPFCVTKCNYCHFYSLGYNKKYNKNTAKDYKEAVIRNVQGLIKPEQPRIVFDTVFFGGGTPSLLYREIAEISRVIPVVDGAEFTFEANPCDINAEMLSEVANSPLNRISIGVQSLDDTLLRTLGRRHDSKVAVNAVKSAYSAGFTDISADVMLGIPGQTERSLTDTLERLTALPINHISAYMYEPKSEIAVTDYDSDNHAALYLQAVELLGKKGFYQYEISNFRLSGKSGKKCRHNLKYWRCEEYIGIGAAAHSHYGGKRFAVKEDVADFIKADLQKTYVTEENPGTFEERVMLGLRLKEGIDLNSFTQNERESLINRAKILPSELININEKSLSLTVKGFLVSNRIIGELVT